MHCNHPLSAGCNGPKAIAPAPVAPINEETSTAASAGKSGTAPLFLGQHHYNVLRHVLLIVLVYDLNQDFYIIQTILLQFV